MKKALVIYHDSCSDGLTAAAIASSWYRSNGFLPVHYGAQHGQLPPSLDGYAEICIVDFSYPLPVMKALLDDVVALAVLRETAAIPLVLLIDHHKTAEPLRELVLTGSGYGHFTPLIDMTKSGALLTWEFFAAHEARDSQVPLKGFIPTAVKQVSKRDMWQHERGDDADALFIWICSSDLSVDDVIDFLDLRDSEFRESCRKPSLLAASNYDEAVKEGHAMMKYRDLLIRESVKHGLDVQLTDHNGKSTIVRMAQTPYALGSDVAHDLIEGMTDTPEGERIAGYWHVTGERQVQIGLRSDGPDVAAIAQAFGGGGHRNASGLRMSWDGFVIQMAGTELDDVDFHV